MIRLKLILITVLVLTTLSCTTNEEPIQEEGPQIEAPSIFKLNVNGLERYSGNAEVFKTEDNFLIRIGYSQFSFDKAGRFGYFNLDLQLTTNQTSVFHSFIPFSSNYFIFNIESIDEVKKRVRGSYSGNLYANPYNLNSEQKYVNGSFDLKYEDLVPGVAELKNTAKINGSDWVQTYRYQNRENEAYHYYITEHSFGNNEFKVMINYDIFYITTGTYNFTPSNITNSVKVSKFDVSTGTMINYNTTGTLTINQREGNIISGNYNLTAVNPNNSSDVVQVNQGVFKLVNKLL